MADYPLPELGNQTPLQVAKTPHMDRIAACHVGTVKTIPDGMDPGSDVANLSLLGYDPAVYHTGRAPFEAGSMGVKLKTSDIAFRMNLVTLDFTVDGRITMVSHSAGDIKTPEARRIVKSLQKELVIPDVRMYPGIAYRHLLVWDQGPGEVKTIPPHDVLDQDMTTYLNNGEKDPIPGLIRRSWPPLKDHPVNLERREKGMKEANSIWLWGQGRAPELALFKDQYGLEGGVISAVDLIKGIGFYAGLESIEVEGATGYLDTNYRGKAEGAIKGLGHLDFCFVHVEAPDEAAHNGNVEEKLQAIEDFDEKVVGNVIEGLGRFDDYRIMVASDHYTPICKKTHTREPAPFAFAGKAELDSGVEGTGYTEASAIESGQHFEKGHELMGAFLGID